ncbi:MAG: SDR family NAD(P)-dependent oxidoreductase [Alphaproteobacteria bacterium]|jgi:3-oxoacyl-[acyl-carrier protein] reductase
MNVVITGTSRGIGLSLAEYYLSGGCRVAGCSRSESPLTHPDYKHYTVDLSQEADVNRFAADVRKDFGSVDVLINNAGVASMNHFMLTPVETARRLMNINFFGPFAATRAFINALKKSDHPRVVNFSTVAVPFNLDGELAYVSSKAAVESMTKILAKELAPFKITVNAVGPTPVKTALTAKVPEKKLKELLDRQAIKRFGEFEDIRNVIDFYISPASDFITGQIVYLGGVNK